MVQRGLFLFALLGAIAVVTLFAVFYRPETALKEAPPTEFAVSMIGMPAAGFPSSVTWAAVYQLGDTMPSSPGWQIRYNATRALAHRGSARVPLDILAEMLDERQQLRNNVAIRDGKRVVDEASAHIIVMGGLKAVRAWLKYPDAVAALRDDSNLQKIHRAVERLQSSSSPTVQAEAKETRLAIEKTIPRGA
jgi:hypothetical protein